MGLIKSLWLAGLGLMSTAVLANGQYLADIKLPEKAGNLHVHKLSSSATASDFVVFVRKEVPLHRHLEHDETVFVLEGTGVFHLDGVDTRVGPGHYVRIPKGAVHGVVVTSEQPMKVLSIQAPEFFGKDRVWVNPPKKG